MPVAGHGLPDDIVELSLKLAKAARKQWPLRRYEDEEE
jgi:hypothetical protein